MVITPKLEYFIKADGTANVYIYVYDPATRLKAKIPTPYYVKPGDWDRNQVDRKRPNANYLNPLLRTMVSKIENFVIKNPGLLPVQVKQWYEGGTSDYTPATYFREYIKLCQEGKIVKKFTKEKMKSGYLRALGTSASHLEKYGKVNWEMLSEEFFDKYVNFLRSLNLKQNTIAKSVKHFIMIIDHARRKKIHPIEIKYSVQTVKSQKIRLTPEEVDKIIQLDLKDWPELKGEQERFQVAYNLLLRFGDSVDIKEKNIIFKGDKPHLSTFTQKGQKEILLPLKKSVYNILKRNGFQLRASNSKSNQKLKKIGMLAGIISPVIITEFKDGKKTETVYKKYQRIETHTTRRSAARNLFDSGMAPEIIMTLGGWSTMKQLLEYIDIDLDYAASKAAEHPFFN